MIPLHQLLERFVGVTNTEKTKKQIIINELKNKNIHIELHNIKFSKNSIIIQASPIIKTEIMLVKQEILDELKRIKETSLFFDLK